MQVDTTQENAATVQQKDFKLICISGSGVTSGIVPVTFDNNADQNYWSYHTKDSNYPNVSGLIVFCMQSMRSCFGRRDWYNVYYFIFSAFQHKAKIWLLLKFNL